jgi:seryl-tRNA synthetase
MIEQASTPVDIIMEFIALQNTRKEAAERLQSGTQTLNDRLNAAKSSADKAVAQLMNELSNFGDAVKAGVNKENEFFDNWNKIAPNTATLPDEEKDAVFTRMENDLYAIYLRVLKDEKNLPASIIEILQTQAGELELGFQK